MMSCFFSWTCASLDSHVQLFWGRWLTCWFLCDRCWGTKCEDFGKANFNSQVVRFHISDWGKWARFCHFWFPAVKRAPLCFRNLLNVIFRWQYKKSNSQINLIITPVGGWRPTDLPPLFPSRSAKLSSVQRHWVPSEQPLVTKETHCFESACLPPSQTLRWDHPVRLNFHLETRNSSQVGF